MVRDVGGLRTPPAPPGEGASRGMVRLLLRRGPMSRAELARRLELSPATLTRLASPLLGTGLLRETGTEPAGPGRPSRPLEVVPDALRVAGVNLTGDRATGVVIGLDGGVVAHAESPLTDRAPEAVVAQVAELVRCLERGPDGGPVPVDLVGVSLGGDVGTGYLVRRAPFLGWSDLVPLGAMCEQATGRKTVVDNDLTALTKSEHWSPGSEDRDRFVLVTLGVGLGYGLVMHDRVVEGPDAGLGPLGHFPAGATGYFCAEGHEGCAHSLLLIASLERAVSEAAGERLDYEVCLDRARRGDEAAGRVVGDAGRALGRVLATVCNLALTDRVVVTGEGVGLAEVARRSLDEGIAELRDPLARPVRVDVRPVDFGLYARGAAAAAVQAWLEGEVGR